ncbi:site-specific integrase [Laspinema sp. D1]|uniref:Site-specific integrase n=1 Tax=Laspinema palackyanum D2a TaxID=2953684 RepID=A0ABT2MKB6_9CYAN|nr:site-specific integrase [Laspinema sp. D2a]
MGEIFCRYREAKAQELKPSSLKNLDSVIRKIPDFPRSDISPEAAKAISQYLLRSFSRDSARRALQQLGAACNWAVERGELEANPFDALQLKPQKKRPKVDPFSEKERDRIIAEFERDPIHRHYAGFVRFLFLTGCRTSEAVGLRWGDCDREFIKFCSPVVEGIRLNSTKTGEVRRFPINSQLRELLESIRPDGVESDRPVFTSKSGDLVSPNNFLRRHWKPVLEKVAIAYRPQYNTRHSFATFCLTQGESPARVAQWIGDSVPTLMRYYAGYISGEIPNF